jgi:6,7-dimethyl-8-ribityllumazine synthase
VKQPPLGRADAAGLRVLLLRAAFNADIVEGLARGAREALLAEGAAPRFIEEVEVPGAFELPLGARAAARSGRFDAIVALGAVVRGDTDHYEHVAREAASGLMRVSLETGVPVAFGVLTVRRELQARGRARPGAGNKGAEAARAAVTMARTLTRLAGRRAGRR